MPIPVVIRDAIRDAWAAAEALPAGQRQAWARVRDNGREAKVGVNLDPRREGDFVVIVRFTGR